MLSHLDRRVEGGDRWRDHRDRRQDAATQTKAAMHMVIAWWSADHVSLGQVATDAKRSEITADPKLLDIFDVSGCMMTIDVMGCQ